MKLEKENIIKQLSMIKHPEGGYYAQTFRSFTNVDGITIGLEKSEYRPLSTSIYFLLSDKEVSHFHRLKSDEIWYYHGGETLIVTIINTDGELKEYSLGMDLESGELPQIVVPAGAIFGSYVESGEGTSLVGCMVSFGFNFEDFELFTRDYLLLLYPKHSNIIKKLTF